MQKLFYVLLGLTLFNSSPLLADTPAEKAPQSAENTVTNNDVQGRDDDC